jgi:filamentous hemagglutinin family protein
MTRRTVELLVRVSPALTRTTNILVVLLSLWLLSNHHHAQAADPVTSSGLHTHVNLSAISPAGKTQYDITGGTRPGGGANLFHSFGNFNVPTNNIANFLNGVSFDVNGNPLPTGLQTTNILGRVTGGTISDIFGAIQTSGFGSANLFLMNPAGFIFGPNASVNVGGMVTFTTANHLKFADNMSFNAVPDVASDALLSALPVVAFGFIGSNPHAIDFKGGQLTVMNGTGVTLVGGDINLAPSPISGTQSSITASGKHIRITSVAGTGDVSIDTGLPAPGVDLGTITIGQDTLLSTVGDPAIGNGSGGSVSIRGGQLVAMGATIDTSTASTGGDSGAVTLATNGSLSLTDSTIFTKSDLSGNGGAVTLTGRDVTMDRVHIITDVNSEPGLGPDMVRPGAVTVTAQNTVTISGLDTDDPIITTTATGTLLDAGPVKISGKTVNLSNGLIDTNISNNNDFISPGNGGTIDIRGKNINLAQFQLKSIATGNLESSGTGGNILLRGVDSIRADNIQLTASSAMNAGATSGGGGGNIAFQTKALTISDHTEVSTSSFGKGSGGAVMIRGAENVTIESGAKVITDVVFSPPQVSQGTAGDILLETQNLIVRSGGSIRANAEPLSTGNAGTITVRGTDSPAQSVLIDGPSSGIFTDAQGTGAGGNIVVNANTVTLQNGGKLSAKTSGTETTAIGGSITVNTTDHVTMTSGALITASSTGPGDAGGISINAGQQLDLMGKSSITTEAKTASGGDIDIQAVDRVRLVDSSINTSVFGGDGNGGNITIDPNVVVLQGSQVKAEAFQGVGGDITITTPLFLADSTSTVSALSPFGLNGTVTIQSPTSNLSGSLGPLTSKPSQAQALLTQRCAALASGQASSFVIAGREQLPADPGGWLNSPLTFAALGESLDSDYAVTSAPAIMPMASHDTGPVSLRRLTPTGFLMANFAESEATGCHS